MVNNHEMSAQFGEWVIAKDHPPSIAYVVLSAFAEVVSYLIARLFHLPEAYWAPMSTLIVMKLTLSAALPIAVQYVVGTAVGAAVGAGTDIYFHSSIWSFGAAVVIVGLLCVAALPAAHLLERLNSGTSSSSSNIRQGLKSGWEALESLIEDTRPCVLSFRFDCAGVNVLARLLSSTAGVKNTLCTI